MTAHAVRGIVALLIVIGLLSVILRSTELAQSLRDERGTSALDRAMFKGAAAMLELDPASARYEQAERELSEFSGTFIRHPLLTFLHLLAAGLFVLLAPLQFSERFRNTHLQLHRWCGRLLLSLVLAIGLTAFFFGLLMPFGGRIEAAAILLFGSLFLFAGARAFRAIRRRDIARHREWMIRMFAIALGVATVRLVGAVLLARSGGQFRATFGPSLWLGWLLTLGCAELWIRHTRHTRTGTPGTPGTAVPGAHGAVGAAAARAASRG